MNAPPTFIDSDSEAEPIPVNRWKAAWTAVRLFGVVAGATDAIAAPSDDATISQTVPTSTVNISLTEPNGGTEVIVIVLPAETTAGKQEEARGLLQSTFEELHTIAHKAVEGALELAIATALVAAASKLRRHGTERALRSLPWMADRLESIARIIDKDAAPSATAGNHAAACTPEQAAAFLKALLTPAAATCPASSTDKP